MMLINVVMRTLYKERKVLPITYYSPYGCGWNIKSLFGGCSHWFCRIAARGGMVPREMLNSTLLLFPLRWIGMILFCCYYHADLSFHAEIYVWACWQIMVDQKLRLSMVVQLSYRRLMMFSSQWQKASSNKMAPLLLQDTHTTPPSVGRREDLV